MTYHMRSPLSIELSHRANQIAGIAPQTAMRKCQSCNRPSQSIAQYWDKKKNPIHLNCRRCRGLS